MKKAGADEVRLEMLEMAGEVGGRIPKEWRICMNVPMWKRKGDVHDTEKYRSITLLSQVDLLKLLERVLDARIRRE